MAKKTHTFILSDEGLNRYGFRVLTSGIDSNEFENNPVMFYDHRKWSYRPIGKWENLRVEDGKLKANAIIDDTSDFDKEIKAKVEKGVIKGASIGIDVIELSESPEYLVSGQTRKTVTKCVLREVSLTADPANTNALKLNFPDKNISLSGNTEYIDELIGKLNSNTENMKTIALKLGLAEDATAEQINQKIEELAKLKPSKENNKETEGSDKLVNAFLAMGKKSGLITDKNEAKFTKLAKLDIDIATEMIEELSVGGEGSQKDTLRVSQIIAELKKGGSGDGKEEKKDYEYYMKNDSEALSAMEVNDPAKFKKLYDAWALSK